MSDPLTTFDRLRMRFSELHSDLVMNQWTRAVEKVDDIEQAFKELRLEIRAAAAEVTLTGGNDPERP